MVIMQYARYNVWARSFWGANSNGNRNGFNVNTDSRVNHNNTGNEFGVAPAFGRRRTFKDACGQKKA